MTPINPDQSAFRGVAQASVAASEAERAERVAKLNDRVRLDLWKAVWEASQVMSTEQIQDHVLGTLREIESDEP